MIKKIQILNPLLNKKVPFIFSILFLLNSLYYSYHAIFTPFIPQLINCKLIYFFLSIFFIFLFLFSSEKSKIDWKKLLKTFIFILLPSALIILAGYLKYPENFKDNAQIVANLFIVFSSFFIFLKLSGYKKIGEFFSEFRAKKEISTEEKRDKKQNFLITLVVFLVIVLNLSFGLYHLAEFSGVDEPLWTSDRIPKFWNNVLDGEWQKTRISDKPGITVALISGVGRIWADESVYNSINWQGGVTGPIESIKKLNFSFRFPILFFNALSLILLFFLLKKLLGRFNAVASIIFIGLSPILLGISRIINPDSLFWVFSTLSLLSYFIFLKKSEKKYVFLTGIFLGLSLLTKYVANFFFLFYFFMIFADFIFNKKEESWKEYFKKSLRNYGVITYCSLLTFFLLLPAAWIDLSRITEGTIFSEVFLKFLSLFAIIVFLALAEIYFFKGKVFQPILNYLSGKKDIIIKIVALLFLFFIVVTVLNVWLGMKWLDFEEILASPKSSKTLQGLSGLMFSDFYSLIFGIHPLAFIFIILLLINIIFSRKKNEKHEIWPIYIILFIFLYYLAYVANLVGATVRYQIIVYPLAFILASLGLRVFLSFLHCRGKVCFLVLAILILSQSFCLNRIRPFYFSYASDFLPKKYILNLKDMGDGSYEAAQYLNNLSDAKNLIVWTDKKGVCSFFIGNCFGDYKLKYYGKIDYFVVSSGRESRTERQRDISAKNSLGIVLEDLYDDENYEYKLEIGGRPNNYLKVFSYEKISSGKN